jgi:hypothetical protein
MAVVKFTGHPLADVGVATLCALRGKNNPDALTLKDLDRVADELRNYYFSGLMTSYLSCVFMNAEYVQPGKGKELFDGSEVVPKIFEEYLEWLERDPLLASSLLVPITSRQAGWLNWQGRLTSPSDGVRVANAAYDAEIGLQLYGWHQTMSNNSDQSVFIERMDSTAKYWNNKKSHSPNINFIFQHYRFQLEPKCSHMTAYNKGNVIRGGFGITFRRIVCHANCWSRKLASYES